MNFQLNYPILSVDWILQALAAKLWVSSELYELAVQRFTATKAGQIFQKSGKSQIPEVNGTRQHFSCML